MMTTTARHQPSEGRILGILLALALLSPGLAHAGSGETSKACDEDTPSFQIFGYLSQAYAISDGHQLLGITKEGTLDYRTLAIQARFSTPQDREVVVQIAHERIGASSLQQFKSDLALDWAFFRTPLGDATSLAVGRVPIPVGIYNEIRDVGPLLPFYRPPFLFYSETAYAAETLDGIRISHELFQGSPWSVQAHAFFGDTTLPEIFGPIQGTTKVKNGFGVQIWLLTPVPGLRFGLNGLRLPTSDSVLRPGQKANDDSLLFSAEGRFQTVDLRGESRWFRLGQTSGVTYYLQGSLRLGKRWAVHAQGTATPTEVPPFGTVDIDQDLALGVTYKLAPQQVLKLEAHRDRGFAAEDQFPDLSQRPVVTNYGILSLSTSF
jgi:hypothetical protein